MKKRGHIVLKSAYERLKRSNPKFSIRALATQVGVSHVFLMKLLKGDATIPDKKIPTLIKVLKLDDLAQAELREAMVYDVIHETLDAFPGLKAKRKLAAESFEEYPTKHFSVLDNWYDIVILDFLTCHRQDCSVLGMARALGLTTAEVEASLEKSSKVGLAKFDKLGWTKTSNNMRLPTSNASEITRRYYEQVLDKVQAELRRTTPEDFARRSITNLSIAVDPAKLPEAKQRLQQAIYVIAQDLSEGTPTYVYHLTTCLTPVTAPES